MAYNFDSGVLDCGVPDRRRPSNASGAPKSHETIRMMLHKFRQCPHPVRGLYQGAYYGPYSYIYIYGYIMNIFQLLPGGGASPQPQVFRSTLKQTPPDDKTPHPVTKWGERWILFPNNQGSKSLIFVIETQKGSPKRLKLFYRLSKHRGFPKN